MAFYCSPALGNCTDVRVTKDSYDQAKESASDTWSYLTSRPKDDIDLDSSTRALAEFNLSAGRNECNLKEQTVVLDFLYDAEPNTLMKDEVVMKWGVFYQADDEDISLVRGSLLPESFFNTMSFNDVYSDRGFIFTMNTLNWLLSALWVFGMPFQTIILLIFYGYLLLKLLDCLNLMQSNDFSETNEEQAELFSEANFIEGPVMRWTISNILTTFIGFFFTPIPGLGFLVNTYIWSLLNVMNYTIY